MLDMLHQKSGLQNIDWHILLHWAYWQIRVWNMFSSAESWPFFRSMLIEKLIGLRKVRTENWQWYIWGKIFESKFPVFIVGYLYCVDDDFHRQFAQKIFKSQVTSNSSPNPANAGLNMAFWRRLSFATVLTADFGCNPFNWFWFRFYLQPFWLQTSVIINSE